MYRASYAEGRDPPVMRGSCVVVARDVEMVVDTTRHRTVAPVFTRDLVPVLGVGEPASKDVQN